LTRMPFGALISPPADPGPVILGRPGAMTEPPRETHMREDARYPTDVQQIPIIIQTEPGPIPMWDLAEFFRLFRIAYAASYHALEGTWEAREPLDIEESIQRTFKYWQAISETDARQVRRPKLVLPPAEPTILLINRENPFLFVAEGIGICLALAVILSGGKFQGYGIRVELPPLGKGIEQLRKSLRRSPTWDPRDTRLARNRGSNEEL